MKFRIYIIRVLCISTMVLSFAPYSMASVTEKDVVVVTRIIGLLENGPKGVVEIAVIKGDPAIKNDTEEFISIAGNNSGVGGIQLKPVALSYDELERTNAKVLFIPEGMSDAHLTRIFEIAVRRKIVTISNSPQCLNLQKCAISVTSSPAVDIKISVAAAAATNVSFGSTFRMMIKEVR